MSDEVWRGGTWFPPTSMQRSEVVSWKGSFEVTSFTVEAGHAAGRPVFRFIVLGDGRNRFVDVDPFSAEEVAALAIVDEAGDDLTDPFDAGTLEWLTGWEAGPASAHASVEVPDLGWFERVVARSAAADWERVPGFCPTEVALVVPVALDRALWYVWADGSGLAWVRLAP